VNLETYENLLNINIIPYLVQREDIMDFSTKLREFIKKHEGVRAKVYKDTLGIPTIGVGFNLLRPDARQICSDFGIDYDIILSGQAILTMKQIDDLLDKDIKACVDDLKVLFSDWDSRPENFKLVLTDMRFQLGRKRS
jgi:hypothetical protein